MASLSRRSMAMVKVMVVAAAAMVTVTVQSAGATGVGEGPCPAGEEELVYPYWSVCSKPAVYYGQEVYELQAAGTRDVSGFLAPEYDESNSTYYLRLGDVGAKYKLMHITREYRPYVKQSHDVLFVNVDTGRALGWRQEGEDEFFLVETDTSTARFQFAAAENVALPCPRILFAHCEAYYIVSFGNTSSGLTPHEEDNGATYFTKGVHTTGIPFLLLRSSSSTTSNSVLLQATKS